MKRTDLWCILGLLALASCHGQGDQAAVDSDSGLVIAIGDTSLYRQDVERLIPLNVRGADSLAMSQAITDAWIEEMLITEVAEDYLGGTADIERRVEEFRRRLIVSEYRRMLASDPMPEVPESAVKQRFDSDSAWRSLPIPIVKGILIRLPEGSGVLGDVTAWLQQGDEASLEKVERYGVAQATAYDSFTQRWMDWPTVSDQWSGNGRLGPLPGEGMHEHRSGGQVSLLLITQQLAAGNPAPYEYAAPLIRSQLASERGVDTYQQLLRNLYQRGLGDEKIRLGNQGNPWSATK